MKIFFYAVMFLFLSAQSTLAAPSKDSEATNVTSTTASANSKYKKAAIPNGLYLVIQQAPVADDLKVSKKSEHIVVNDCSFLEPEDRNPTYYALLSTDEFIPIDLQSTPDKGTDQKGKPMLGLTLKEAQKKPLADFTKRNLGKTIAIVIDGQIVTAHKIKTEITEGKLQITRCSDTGCKVLYTVLCGDKK